MKNEKCRGLHYVYYSKNIVREDVLTKICHFIFLSGMSCTCEICQKHKKILEKRFVEGYDLFETLITGDDGEMCSFAEIIEICPPDRETNNYHIKHSGKKRLLDLSGEYV
jgi:hypothetical protein